MSAPIGAIHARPPVRSLARTYRGLLRLGFGDAVASDLTAVSMGVPVTARPWSVSELTHLAFLRELAGSRRAWSAGDDRACRALADGWKLPRLPNRQATQAEGRITLLTLLQAAAGREATLDALAPRIRLPQHARSHSREGG